MFDGAGTDGEATEIRLSELFSPGKDSLVLYGFMFPRHAEDERPKPKTGETAKLSRVEGPFPSCTAFLDQLEGAAEHFSQRANLAIVAKAPIERVLTFGRERGWQKLRLLSSAGNDFKRDYLAEAEDGSQVPMMNVFHRNGAEIRHVWGSELFQAPTDADQDPRHTGTLEPLWNLFDLTPEGRPTDWDEQLSYPDGSEQEDRRQRSAA